MGEPIETRCSTGGLEKAGEVEGEPVVRELRHDIDVVAHVGDVIPHVGEHRIGRQLDGCRAVSQLAAGMECPVDLVDIGADMERSGGSDDLDGVTESAESVDQAVEREFDAASDTRAQRVDRVDAIRMRRGSTAGAERRRTVDHSPPAAGRDDPCRNRLKFVDTRADEQT